MLVYIDDREDEELENTYGNDYSYGYDYAEGSREEFYDCSEGVGSYFC